jgi:MFS family permease
MRDVTQALPSDPGYPTRIWVVPLALTVMVGFGVILYGFSVYTTDQAAGSDFSTTALSLSFSGSVFVGGLLAIPVGRFADRHGVRLIIGCGAVLGGLGLVGFSIASQAWHLMAAWWLLLGPAQAMVYYEPAYIAIDQWAPPGDRPRTLATITLIGGLAGVVFIPLIAQMVDTFGWRPATRGLGVALLTVGLFAAVMFLPGDGDRNRDRQVSGTGVAFLRERRFLLYTGALILILLSTQGVIAHRVARFEEVGFPLATVAAWAAIASAMSLPGRWVAPRLAHRYGATRVQAVIAVVVASSVLLMVDGSSWWHMAGHFSLFGLAFGALLPLRSMVMSAWYSGPDYGRIMGTQWTAVVLVAAQGPLLVGALRDATDDYAVAFVVLTLLFVAAASVIAASDGRGSSDRVAS